MKFASPLTTAISELVFKNSDDIRSCTIVICAEDLFQLRICRILSECANKFTNVFRSNMARAGTVKQTKCLLQL